MFFNNISAVAQNPCLSAAFQPPLYALSDISVIKTFERDYGGDDNRVSENFGGTFNFTVRDVANNYSLSCSWGRNERRGYGSKYNDWGWANCVDPATGTAAPFESRIATLLNLDSKALLRNRSLQNPVRIAQYWWCDVVNGSYPESYQARAAVFLDIKCPETGKRGSTVPCSVTQPAMVKAQWIPRGALFPGTHHLEPRPTLPPVTVGISPPPSRDCSDVSFTYLYWTIHDFTYQDPRSWDNPAATASLNISLTSRVTGVCVRCQWGQGVGVAEYSNNTMIPVCAPEVPDPLHSDSTFLLRFNTVAKTVSIEQRWVCGDTAGTYSTNFSAQSAASNGHQVALPLHCSSRLCILDTPFRIDGWLTSPGSLSPSTKFQAPEGISTPNCLANSQLTTEYNSPLAITRFMWQATTAMETMHFGNVTKIESGPYTYNRTLVVQVLNRAANSVASCAFNDRELDGQTAKWWPCFRDRASSQEDHGSLLQRNIETWIQFGAQAGQLRINQTWYCNSDDGLTPYQITASGVAPHLAGWNPYSGIFCGNGSNSVSGMPCPRNPVITGDSCDYVFSTQWCTLGDRDGYDNRPGGPLKIPLDDIDVVRLPTGEFTEPEPRPEVWSCTVASLGRGPVKWTLQMSEGMDFFAQTDWFGLFSDMPEVMSTWFTFELNNSALAGFPPTMASKDGIIRHVGVREDIFDWIGVMTPGMRTFDPLRLVRHSDFGKGWAAGWKFYNALDWNLRFDISTGYMELNHSWYCDDKNLDKPLVFNGTWNGYLPLDCMWELPGPVTGGGVTRHGVKCQFSDGKRDFVVTPTVVHRVSETKIPDRNVWA